MADLFPYALLDGGYKGVVRILPAARLATVSTGNKTTPTDRLYFSLARSKRSKGRKRQKRKNVFSNKIGSSRFTVVTDKIVLKVTKAVKPDADEAKTRRGRQS